MSFFKRMFGGGSFDESRAEGDRLFEQGELADARLAYERAVERKKGAPASAIEHCEARMIECLDGMARARVEEAERLAEAGEIDLAEDELRSAMELAKDPEIVERARRRMETLEKEDAIRAAELPEEMSDEDRWAILAGTWEDEQIDEYDEYGEPFREALLAMHEGELAPALEALEALLEEAEEPVYLWLEIGRARALAEDFDGAEEALREFLEHFEDEEGGESRLLAHASLARLRDRADDEEGAVEELSAAMEAFPHDPRPFLMMGQFLRSKGHADEAVEVLEAGRALLDEDRFDWRYYQEIGLAQIEAGDEELGADYLDRVIAFFVSVRRHDQPLELPPEAAVARAKLYEEEERLDKAADLYRALADGPDRENHLTYHREAGRLLLALELDEEARRMFTRALALADDDDEARGEIEAQLAELS